MAEGSGSRTHQTHHVHLAGFEVRALHRDTIPFRFVVLPVLLLHLGGFAAALIKRLSPST